MAHVTVPAARAINRYQVATAQASFAVTFPFFSPGDLVVTKWTGATKAPLSYSASPANEGQFSVAGTKVDGGYSNGVITIGGAGVSNCTLTIRRNIMPAREVDYAYPSQSIDIRSLNTDQDRAIAMIGDAHYTQQRSIRASEANDDADLELPPLAPRRVPVVNSAGTGVEFTAYDPDTTVALANDADTIAKEARDLAASASAAAELAGVVSTREWTFTLVSGQQIYGPLPVAAARVEAVDLYIAGVRQIGNFAIEDDIFGPGLGIELTPTVTNSPASGQIQAGLEMFGNVKGGIVESAIPSQSIFGRHFHDGAIQLDGPAILSAPPRKLLQIDAAGRPAWVGETFINFGNRGGVGDDATTNDAALTAALADLPSGGGAIYVPPGVFRFSAPPTFSKAVTLFGAGQATALRMMHATNDMFVFGSGAGGSIVEKLQIVSGVTRVGGAVFQILANGVTVQNVKVYNYYGGVVIGDDTTLGVAARVRACDFSLPSVGAAGGFAIFARNFSNAVIDHCIITGTASGAQPDSGIRFWNGDTAIITGTNVTRHGAGLFIDTPAGKNCYSVTATGSWFDSAGSTLTRTASSAEILPYGNVVNLNFSKTWFGLSESQSGINLAPQGAGNVDGAAFDGCEFIGNAQYGAVWSVRCLGVQVNGGVGAANTIAALRAAAGASSFSIMCFKTGQATRANNGRAIVVDDGPSNNYKIKNNILYTGNSISPAVFDGGTGTNKSVELV